MKISDVTIVIPSVKLDSLTEKCITICNKLYPEAEIIVLVDWAEKNTLCDKFKLIICGPLTIAAKRNKAAYKARGKLLAFIDSDAFPSNNWLLTTVNEFKKNKDLVALAGPNVMPLDSIGNEKLVGLIEKSPLVTINAHYIKSKEKCRYVKTMPSCNLIVSKSFYLEVGGMNEKLFGGEDFEFCKRLSSTGKRILYHPEVLVFHKSRSLISFLKKRISYGGFAYDNISLKMNIEMMISTMPILNTMVFLCFPITIFFSETKFFYSIYLFCFFFTVFIESARLAKVKKDFFLIYPVLLLAILLPGLGSILRMFKILPSYQNIYKNYD